MIAGLYYPLAAAIWGFVYALGRILYAVGYKKNTNFRLVAAPFVLGTQFGLPIFAIVAMANMAGTGTAITYPANAQ